MMGADTALSAQTSNEPAPGARTLAEVTADNMIRELDEARTLALRRGQASAAVTAILAKARLAGLLNDRGESNAETAKFDGNYVEAARRISLLLRLANRQVTRVKSIE
jgi:1,6-anhydro-N-acetylmuramate kinase